MHALDFAFGESRSRASPYRPFQTQSSESKLSSYCVRKSFSAYLKNAFRKIAERFFKHAIARLIANAQKTPFAQMCKGRMSRGTTFSCKASLRISFFCNGKSRNHLLTEALISRFSSECTPPRHSLPDAFFLLWLQQSSSKATFRSCSPR